MTLVENTLYDNLVDFNIATKSELNLAYCIMGGPWRTVLETVLFIRTGYRSWQQFWDGEYREE